MEKWTSLAIVGLIISSIRIFTIIVSSVGWLLLGNRVFDELGSVVYYANSFLHLAILLLLAYLLNLIKESISISVAFIFSALAGLGFTAIGILQLTDTKILGMISAINFLIVLFFTIQSFLIKNSYFKSGFKWYGIVLLMVMLMSMGIPYLAYYLALPMQSLHLTSIIYVAPAIIEVLLFNSFYQYFNKPNIYQQNHSTDQFNGVTKL